MQRKTVAANSFGATRRGISVPEVIVVFVIVGLFVLFLLMSLPRQRESARLVGCQKNLMQIGVALALYDQATGHLPLVAAGLGGAEPSTGPLLGLLDELGTSDFTALADANHPPANRPGAPAGARAVPGFVCAADPNATSGHFPAPINYRACTGDQTDGRNGAFAPGRRVRLAEVEASDGTGFTIAFAERLAGNNRARPAPMNYALVAGPPSREGCPRVPDSSWRGDAGTSWLASDWRSTLYNHALTLNPTASCIAGDGRSAYVGASSGHLQGVNALLCDGSVKTFSRGVAGKVWRAWASFPDESEDDSSPSRR